MKRPKPLQIFHGTLENLDVHSYSVNSLKRTPFPSTLVKSAPFYALAHHIQSSAISVSQMSILFSKKTVTQSTLGRPKNVRMIWRFRDRPSIVGTGCPLTSKSFPVYPSRWSKGESLMVANGMSLCGLNIAKEIFSRRTRGEPQTRQQSRRWRTERNTTTPDGRHAVDQWAGRQLYIDYEEAQEIIISVDFSFGRIKIASYIGSMTVTYRWIVLFT